MGGRIGKGEIAEGILIASAFAGGCACLEMVMVDVGPVVVGWREGCVVGLKGDGAG